MHILTENMVIHLFHALHLIRELMELLVVYLSSRL
jgi:hypothetical protein